MKRNLKTNTYSVIDDNLIIDPTADEVAISNYYFSVILFDDDGTLY
jgi:exosome complex RNA-binding protein Rrp42 (RNase PH superfamily)